jgi:cystathionine gamma-synthase
MKTETISVRGGQDIDPTTGAVTPPIHLSTTFERDPDGEYPLGYYYSRSANPNRSGLERALSALEGGSAAAAFASGSMAMMAILQALLPGDHVIAPLDIYYGIRRIIQEIFMPWGLEVTFVDMTREVSVAQAMQENTRLLIVETPSNPLLKITDLPAISAIARKNGAFLACDNTIATPILQRPLDLGADFVVHATTKYLSGHSDVVGGMVVTRDENRLFERIRLVQTVGGAVPSPFDCWLALRGIHTLPYRMRAISENGLVIARFLADHPAVEQVLYPGLEDNPYHRRASRQMTGFGGLMSILVRGDRERAMAVAAGVKLFTRATSFGGSHSLIEHRASMESPGTTTPENLLRLSIGLENAKDLIADLAQALDDG